MKQFYLSMLVIISVACGYTIAEQPVEVDEPIKEQIEEQVSEPAVEAVQEQTAEEIIVEIFRPEHADLIALNTHGRSGLSQLFNGSIGQELANHALRPVITFKI